MDLKKTSTPYAGMAGSTVPKILLSLVNTPQKAYEKIMVV